MKVAIIGGGAAGCFCAVELKCRRPSCDVVVLEAGKRPLAKVAVTGGGRCNLTNSFAGITSLTQAYPRGERLMKRALKVFGSKETMEWFEREGVPLVTQEDCCVFPRSQDAMQIVGLLLSKMRALGVRVKTGSRVTGISRGEGGFRIESTSGVLAADAVVVTTGGKPTRAGYSFLDSLGLEMVAPVPSLFTFNLPDSPVRALMGTVVEDVLVSLAGTGFKASGPLLVTHWGMSGPSVLKLSSYAARHLAENAYDATLLVNWLASPLKETAARIGDASAANPRKLVANARPSELPGRLWEYLVSKSGIRQDARWADIGAKSLNRLADTLCNDGYRIHGRTRFKDEFVTCGGVSLEETDLGTLESKKHPGLFFAGEVLDVDAVTGGFNLQAAWSTGWIAARSVSHIQEP